MACLKTKVNDRLTADRFKERVMNVLTKFHGNPLQEDIFPREKSCHLLAHFDQHVTFRAALMTFIVSIWYSRNMLPHLGLLDNMTDNAPCYCPFQLTNAHVCHLNP